MPTHINIGQVRRSMGGRDLWYPPTPHGPDGWRLTSRAGLPFRSVLVSCANFEGVEWIHASIACEERLPNYSEMYDLHRGVWGDDGYSYEIHPPKDQHVNIHQNALHLWGRADGKPVLPEFGKFGTI